MNKQKFLKTLVVFLCTLGFSSCVYDNELENGCGTYMSAVLSEGYVPLRAQEDHSINVDATDFEDRVNTLAMLVFSTGSDDRSAYHYAAASTVTANIPATRVNPGSNDIYFFANVPEGEVKDLTTRDKVEAYMKETKEFNSALNKGATAALGFPMSRVYYGQNIPEGYTVTNPYGWKPNTDGSGNLAPVSTYEDVKDPIQGKVGLVRTCAKISVNIKGEGVAGVKKVEYVNAFKQHSMKQLEAKTFADTELQTLELFTNTGATLDKELVVYVPECLFDISTASKPSWDTTKDVGVNGVNYLKITMDSEQVYTAPIVHNGNSSVNSYLEIAKSDRAIYDIVRNNHYHFNVSVPEDGKELKVVFEVQPWNLIENVFSATDDYMNASKEDVVMNYPNEDPNSFMILSNFKNKILSYSVEYADLNDKDWFSMTPATPTSINGNLEFNTKTTSENLGGTPRIATVTFHVDGYAHDVSVRIIQLPRQDIVTRKYVNFIGTGGTVNISVDNYGYDWRAEIVENYSTIAGTPDWVTLNKSGSQLTINVKSTNDVNLLRYAVVKIYDGSDRAAYIWVEQGNYKEVKVNGHTILDRNLGALKTATDRNAWTAGAPISNQERVRVNGFYYQWGRVPDGYHWHGIDVVNGNISTSLASAQVDSTRVDYATHPDAMPLKWWDPVVPASQDPQYGRFIAAESWLSTSGAFPKLWGDPEKVGVDPCPEGYRVPTLAEMKGILSNLTYYDYTQGFWATTSTGTDTFFPRSEFRDSSGTLQMWSRDNNQPYTYYMTSDLDGINAAVALLYNSSLKASEQFVPVGYGVPVRCIKE